MKVSKTLLLGLDKSEIEDFKSHFAGCERLTNQLQHIITLKLTDNHRRRLKGSYSQAAWAMEQADCNGYERAMAQMQEILQIRVDK